MNYRINFNSLKLNWNLCWALSKFTLKISCGMCIKYGQPLPRPLNAFHQDPSARQSNLKVDELVCLLIYFIRGYRS